MNIGGPQKLHLLTSCQFADKLLGEIESILVAPAAKSPFPKFRQDLSPTQAKVVRDSIARIRSQIVRVLESQCIQPPEAQFGAVHSIRVTLGFAGIAFDECRNPKQQPGSECDQVAGNRAYALHTGIPAR